ncbi:hypothetical protein FDECE_1016 [Fusarium decemcellulare]|nr:hypothetical protein FDECE_1016 [Fusarium decemcellulare]
MPSPWGVPPCYAPERPYDMPLFQCLVKSPPVPSIRPILTSRHLMKYSLSSIKPDTCTSAPEFGGPGTFPPCLKLHSRLPAVRAPNTPHRSAAALLLWRAFSSELPARSPAARGHFSQSRDASSPQVAQKRLAGRLLQATWCLLLDLRQAHHLFSQPTSDSSPPFSFFSIVTSFSSSFHRPLYALDASSAWATGALLKTIWPHDCDTIAVPEV